MIQVAIDKPQPGRPSSYTPELGKRICDVIANSPKGIRGALEEHDDLPSAETVRVWSRDIAEFSAMFTDARRQQIENMADDIVHTSMDDSLDPNDKRIRIDTKKWLLSKLIPKTYGDKIDVTSGGETIATPSHLIDARVQSIIMQAQMRRRDAMIDVTPLSDEAAKLLE